MIGEKKVEVVIPTYKPGKSFWDLLIKLQEQTRIPDKITIINTQKEFWNDAFTKRFPYLCVKHITQEHFDHGGTRRMAAEASDADVVLFMTQDAVPADKHLVEELLKAFTWDPDIGAVYARQLPRPDCRDVEKNYRSFSYPPIPSVRSEKDTKRLGIRTYFCSNVCAAYRMDLYNRTEGFPPKAIFNEDMIYVGRLLRQGYKVAYAPEAEVVHSHNYTLREQFRRNFDLGVSQAEHPELFGRLRSEREGIAMIKTNAKYLYRKGHPFGIVYLILQSGVKYIGYRFGKIYRVLPRRMILHCTMNKAYWR